MSDLGCVYIYHHLGLGDHITCHGIVRYYCETHNKVYLFVKKQNHDNVKFMYNDIKNLFLITGNDDDVINYLVNNKCTNVKLIGFTLNDHVNLELQFYQMANTPIKYKREKFFINRNFDNELKLFNDLELKQGEYIFVHKGEFQMRPGLIRRDLRIVEPNSHGFFDWMYVIENAKEIHCMDSSFACLIDNMNIDDNIKLYNHRYVRQCPNWMRLYPGKKWIELN